MLYIGVRQNSKPIYTHVIKEEREAGPAARNTVELGSKPPTDPG